VEKVIVEKLVKLGQLMSQESDPEAIRAHSELMDSLLGNLERLRVNRTV
jgi:hypothetical protein